MFTLIFAFVLALVIAAGVYIVFDRSKLGVPAGALLFLIVLVFEMFTIVPAGHVGVQVTLGEVNRQALSEGVHLVNPISGVRNVDVRLQRAELKGATAGTKDMQQVHTNIVVQYRLAPEKVPTIYKEYGLNVDEKVLGPGINEAFKAVTAKYTSEELITKRDAVSADIVQHIKDKVAPFDITINGVSLVDFGFSPDYQKAIEAKVIATQQKQKAEQDLERIKVEAQSRIAQAEGEAKAIKIQAEAIQTNGGAAYVQLRAIEKWDGNLPNVMSGAVPFINVGK